MFQILVVVKSRVLDLTQSIRQLMARFLAMVSRSGVMLKDGALSWVVTVGLGFGIWR